MLDDFNAEYILVSIISATKLQYLHYTHKQLWMNCNQTIFVWLKHKHKPNMLFFPQVIHFMRIKSFTVSFGQRKEVSSAHR